MDNPCLTLPKISYPLSCLDDAVLAALGFGFLRLAFLLFRQSCSRVVRVKGGGVSAASEVSVANP